MLNEKEITDFLKATAMWNSNTDDVNNAVCETEDVVQTKDTIEDFENGLANSAADEKIDTPFGELLIFKRRQRAKGLTRGDLFVLDFGHARAACFSGQ